MQGIGRDRDRRGGGDGEKKRKQEMGRESFVKGKRARKEAGMFIESRKMRR